MFVQLNLKTCLTGLMLLLSCSMVTPVFAEQVAKPVDAVEKVSPEEIKVALKNMNNDFSQRIDQWGKNLKRDDFNVVRGKASLKPAKRQEVCNIFQSVVDETYQLALNNRHRLNEEESKIVADRPLFIQKLGFEGGIIKTEMGFDCRIF